MTNTETAKATARPWKAGGPRYDNQYRVWVADERGRSIAETGRTYHGQDEAVAVANARLIVKAVNHHDELVEALRELETIGPRVAGIERNEGHPYLERWDAALLRARDILARVQESGV